MKVANSNGLVKSAWPVQIGGRSTVFTRAFAFTGALVSSPFFVVLPLARCFAVIFCFTSRISVRGEEKCIFGRTPLGQVARNFSNVWRTSSRSGFRHQKCW